MSMTSDCAAPVARLGGWYHVRIRRFRRAKLATHPEGMLASCAAMPPGTWPAYLSSAMLWASLSYATIELVNFRNPSAKCFVTPSYTGGHGDAYADGKLRRPMCFGTHHEPWARPHGTYFTVHGDASRERPLVLEERQGGWMIALAEGTA